MWIRPPGPVADGLRIGLLGGSFNPAHEGHVHASAVALKTLKLDYVWWLVSPQNPLKSAHGMATFEERLQSARKLARRPRMVVSGIEAELGTVYTVDTLIKLKGRFPQIRFVWLMGSDNMIQIARWRDWPAIFALVPVAVVTRPGTVLKALSAKAAQRFANSKRPADARFANLRPPAWTILDANRHPASATELRARGRP